MDELLDRTKMGIEQKENWSNEYLSSFKVASYVTKEEEEVSCVEYFFHGYSRRYVLDTDSM